MRLGPLRFLDQLVVHWERGNVSNVAASLTYYAVLALFPFLLFMVALGGFMVNPADARALVLELAKVAPPEVTRVLGDRLQSIATRRSLGLLVFGAATSFLSASSGIVALTSALNSVCDVKEHRPFWKVRLISFAATLGAAVFGLLAALIALVAPAAAEWLGPLEKTAETLISVLRLPVAALLMIVVWAALYHFLPASRPKRFHLFTPGAVVGVLLWVAASWAFSYYVERFGRYDVTYGALGGIVVLLLWLWISSIALLLGAQINDIVGRAHRERPKQRKETARLAGALETAVLGALLWAGLGRTKRSA